MAGTGGSKDDGDKQIPWGYVLGGKKSHRVHFTDEQPAAQKLEHPRWHQAIKEPHHPLSRALPTTASPLAALWPRTTSPSLPHQQQDTGFKGFPHKGAPLN